MPVEIIEIEAVFYVYEIEKCRAKEGHTKHWHTAQHIDDYGMEGETSGKKINGIHILHVWSFLGIQIEKMGFSSFHRYGNSTYLCLDTHPIAVKSYMKNWFAYSEKKMHFIIF